MNRVSAMDELRWEMRVPIFKNSLILKQMGIAIGIPFGALILFLFIIKAWYALILIGLTILLTIVLILLLFRGTYDVRYVINQRGISCHTQEKQKKLVRRLAFITFFLGLLKINPTAAGAGLLSASGTDIHIPNNRIRKVKYMEQKKIIRIYGGYGESITLFCKKENYIDVKRHVYECKGDSL